MPYYFFRGGSSRGPYFKRSDLPAEPETLSAVLVAAIGPGHPLNIDGLGGGKRTVHSSLWGLDQNRQKTCTRGVVCTFDDLVEAACSLLTWGKPSKENV